MNRRESRAINLSFEERALLVAALLPGEDAVRAWSSIDRLDIDSLPVEGQRILPLLFKNLDRLGIEHPLMPRLRGLYKRTWYVNQMLFAKAAKVLELFQREGIPTVLLKGMSMVATCYLDAGLRPMNDADIMVPFSDAKKAWELLLDAGWFPHDPLKERQFRIVHGSNFRIDDDKGLDLHWHPMADFILPEGPETSSADFWDSSVEVEIAGVKTRTLSPADQLLHIATHGVRWNSGARLRWIGDCTVLLTKSDIDWDRLVTQAIKRGCTLPMRDTLGLLRDVMAQPIPTKVMADLESTAVSRREKFAHRFSSGEVGLLGRLPALVAQYSRMTSQVKLVSAVADFPQFLRDAWGVESLVEMPGHAVRRLSINFAQRGNSRAHTEVLDSEANGGEI